MRYGTFGPGGGSIPEFVMRTGTIAPFDPQHARHDITQADVERTVRIPVGRQPGVAAGYAPMPAAVSGALTGSDAFGRSRREFNVRGAPTLPQAQQVAAQLKRIATAVRKRSMADVASLGPEIVGGPLASLVRGEAVVLRFSNGVAITAAL